MKPVVVITGTNGQLGWELKQLSVSLEDKFHFIFTDRFVLDLSNTNTIAPFFDQVVPNYFINCAAYTAVDKAETEQELALTINGKSVGVIAECCEKHNCKLITISTDYVFDGKGSSPYTVTTPTDPVNYYGYSKLVGEELAQKNNSSSVIIRTSWVYSTHGNNFVKTMLRLMKERNEVKVVSDQVGSPTYAADLANALIHIINEDQKGNKHSGIYHYSNTGVMSWYDFAIAICNLADLPTIITPIATTEYPTPAKRPAYSVMDLSKTENDFGISLLKWNDSLRACFHQLYL